MEAWVDHPNITAMYGLFRFLVSIVNPVSSVHAGLQGQEAGNTLVDILWGAVNPSGRLPYTIAKSPSDYSTDIGYNHDVNYSEGLYIDYRWFDEVRYPHIFFGVGVDCNGKEKHYTTFRVWIWAQLHVVLLFCSENHMPRGTEQGIPSSYWRWLISVWMVSVPIHVRETIVPELLVRLHDDWIIVTFALTNNGAIDGTEVSDPPLIEVPPSQSDYL